MLSTLIILGSMVCVVVTVAGLGIALVGAVIGAIRRPQGRRGRGAARTAHPRLLVLVAAGLVLAALDRVAVVRNHSGLVGQVVVLERPIEPFDGSRSFQGDGYSLHRSRLPRRVCDTLSDEPERPASRTRWPDPDPESTLENEHSSWVPTPLSPAAIAALEYMHHPGWVSKPADLGLQVEHLEQALRAPGSLVAWQLRRHHYDDGHHVADLDLVLLGIEPRGLVWAKHNC
jgi:hypothetical protein